MIDGKQVYKVKNSDPRTFDNVKVYAGDRFHPEADADYMNLEWENMKGKTGFLYSYYSNEMVAPVKVLHI